jgi:hypothetical protein
LEAQDMGRKRDIVAGPTRGGARVQVPPNCTTPADPTKCPQIDALSEQAVEAEAPARPTLKELLLAETPRAEILSVRRSSRRRLPTLK